MCIECLFPIYIYFLGILYLYQFYFKMSFGGCNMTKYWNFPSTIGGNVNSINNAGLETFRGNALESLTREICQNSLDAVRDKTKPVVVEFERFEIDVRSFPGKTDLNQSLNYCRKTWTEHNKKIEEFTDQAQTLLNKNTMSMLRISDFNTKGLEGAKYAELGSSWSALIKEAGSSNKSDSSGGSFGIGKSAPFLNSKLRTLFYSSYDVTGYESHIGVANIMSFNLPDGSTTTGSGYYTNNNYSTAIEGQLKLDKNFVRTEPGTDVYVTAFEPKGIWKEEIIKSVLSSFFITIFNQELIVKVNGFTIDNQNIVTLIQDLEDTKSNRELKKYCDVLTSEKTIKIEYPEKQYKEGIRFQNGEAILYLMNGDDLNRKVLMTRNTGMRIYEQNRISGSISFTGVLRITGINMNTIFKDMENPEHNKWEANRYEENPKLAEMIFADLRRFIREEVKKHYQEEIKDQVNAVGLGDFLPNKNILEDGRNQKRETLTTKVKTIEKKKVEKKKRKRPQKRGKNIEELEDDLENKYGISDGDKGGLGTGKHGAGGGVNQDDGENRVDEIKNGLSGQDNRRQPSKNPISISERYVCINKQAGKYRFQIASDKSLESARLVFRVNGEQSDFDMPIKDAITNDKEVLIDDITKNTIYLHSIKKNRPFMLDIDIDYDEYCVLEVALYEN